MVEIREHLLENVAMAAAFESQYDDWACIGLPDEDCDESFYLVDFSTFIDPDAPIGTSQTGIAGAIGAFEELAREHYEAKLTTGEKRWLSKRAGAVVEEDSVNGIVTVNFYDTPEELSQAWRDTVRHVERENLAEYGVHRSVGDGALSAVHVKPHFKIRGP